MLFVYHNQCTDVFEEESNLAHFHQRKEGQRKQKTLSRKSGLLISGKGQRVVAIPINIAG